MKIYINHYKRDHRARISTEYSDGRMYSGASLEEIKEKFISDLMDRGFLPRQLNFEYVVKEV